MQLIASVKTPIRDIFKVLSTEEDRFTLYVLQHTNDNESIPTHLVIESNMFEFKINNINL